MLYTKLCNKQIIKELVQNYSTNIELNKFVPKHGPVSENDVKILRSFISNSNRILVLTGAGISTESGIPDYRSEEVGLYARTNHKPMQHLEFLKSAKSRKRYWARNYVGWYAFSQRQPNSVHFIIKHMEIAHRKVSCVVTQNVDNLHFKAGSKNVIELHGSAYRVVCLNCNAIYNRHYVQETLKKLNPNIGNYSTMIRPDGDVDIPQETIDEFHPPSCENCHDGILKPDITFFGDNVPLARVNSVKRSVNNCDGLLVLGSSLSVFSGYRIVLQAKDEGKPVYIVNIGETRGDKLADVKISAKCGDILPKVVKYDE